MLRWDGLGWHHEPPIGTLDRRGRRVRLHGDREVLETILEFAVHDLGARGIGAILVYRPDRLAGSTVESIRGPPARAAAAADHRPADLAPLRHVLAQVDGAAVLDGTGTLRQLGVRLVPSAEAEADVEGYRGMRHTSGRRYSFDDPTATVIVVSEDGPVTVLRHGELLGASVPSAAASAQLVCTSRTVRSEWCTPVARRRGCGPRVLHGASKPRVAGIVRIAGVCSPERATTTPHESS